MCRVSYCNCTIFAILQFLQFRPKTLENEDQVQSDGLVITKQNDPGDCNMQGIYIYVGCTQIQYLLAIYALC